jgi:ribonuclease HI
MLFLFCNLDVKLLTVHTSSKYAIRCVEWADEWEKDAKRRDSNQWLKANGGGAVANQDLIERLKDLLSRLTVKWVKHLNLTFK